MSVAASAGALFAGDGYRCFEMARADVPRLQRFLEENPEYGLAVEGERPRRDAAAEEFESLPPPGFPFAKKWVLAFEAADGAMIGVADLLSDLFAAGIWNVGLFIVATRLHGGGAAQALYRDLERWMGEQGARWSRLGVVAGNTRAERFWEKEGYVDLRLRRGMAMGKRVNDVRVMMKPLAGGSMDEYLALVARDRIDSD